MKTRDLNTNWLISDSIGAHRSPITPTTQTVSICDPGAPADEHTAEFISAISERASKGIYPDLAPFGYRTDTVAGPVLIDPAESAIVVFIYEMFVTGQHCVRAISDATLGHHGVRMSAANVHIVLRDFFYLGIYEWKGRWYMGEHPLFLRPGLFYQAQASLGRLTESRMDFDPARPCYRLRNLDASLK